MADNNTNDGAEEAPEIYEASVVHKQITRGVLKSKFSARRHLVLPQAICPAYLKKIMPAIMENFAPQRVRYNGGIGAVPEWKISCYLEVMDGGIPTADPHTPLLTICAPLLGTVDDLFRHWYEQQNHRRIPVLRRMRSGANALPKSSTPEETAGPVGDSSKCHATADGTHRRIRLTRLMTFITRYASFPGETALLKHVDGAGKVDGSAVIALPGDASNDFSLFSDGGGGLTFWDGNDDEDRRGKGIHYDTRAGDLAFIDRAVWHEACPITAGTRWALVIFYKVH
mmetsp:Transcript_13569/g.27035  ORF Transcript_13569/g.27035 Transcript_13569/m.27035 type:complete len:284 (-) Transcript_13569:30-881(-)